MSVLKYQLFWQLSLVAEIGNETELEISSSDINFLSTEAPAA